MKNMQVLNFGSLNIDHVYQVPHFVRPKETLGCSGYRRFAGGKGLNQSIALARAGLRTAHAGKIGPDGEFLADILRDAGVDVSFLRRGSVATGHACIQVDSSGQNSILLYPGANFALTEEEIRETLDAVSAGTVLLLQNEINLIQFLMDCARQSGLRIAINPAPCTPEVSAYPLNYAEWLFVNEVEAAQLAGREGEPEELAEILASRFPNPEIIMTLGGEGALFRHGNQMFRQPPVPAEVVDTTSAGDTFTGYFIAARLRGMSPEQSMLAASRAAALAVSRAGAAVSIPTAEEVF